MGGWSYAGNIDFSGYQLEFAVLFVFFAVLAIWVYYNSERYFSGIPKHLFWMITLFTGPIGLLIYLYARKKAEY